MPEPLRDYHQLEISTEAFEKRPELSLHIPKIATMWAHVEMHTGLLLAAILGGDAAVAVEMYLSLTATASRNSALRAAAAHKLTEDENEKLECVLKKLKKAASGRNDIIHGLWGVTDWHPDALILLNPNNVVKDLGTAGSTFPITKFRSAAHTPDNMLPQIWRDADFVRVERRISDALSELRAFVSDIDAKYRAPSP